MGLGCYTEGSGGSSHIERRPGLKEAAGFVIIQEVVPVSPRLTFKTRQKYGCFCKIP